jgi:hypothetical protein
MYFVILNNYFPKVTVFLLFGNINGINGVIMDENISNSTGTNKKC